MNEWRAGGTAQHEWNKLINSSQCRCFTFYSVVAREEEGVDSPAAATAVSGWAGGGQEGDLECSFYWSNYYSPGVP